MLAHDDAFTNKLLLFIITKNFDVRNNIYTFIPVIYYTLYFALDLSLQFWMFSMQKLPNR